MKTHRLPDTDLARAAPLPAGERRRELMRLKGGFGLFSYDPVRKATPDLYCAGGAMFASTCETPLDTVLENVRRGSRNEVGRKANVQVAELLHAEACARKGEAVQQGFGRFYVRKGESVAYWADLVVVEGRELIIPNHDFRRGRGFTRLAARFAASVAHYHIREQYSEFAAASLRLVQFPCSGADRSISRSIVSNADLFSFEQLQVMVAETLAVWEEINDEREEEVRHTGTDDSSGWWRGFKG